MSQDYISDANWERLEPLIPKTRGQSAIQPREFIEAICWVANNNGQWERLPARFGNWQTTKNRYRRWLSCNYIEDIIKIYTKAQKQS